MKFTITMKDPDGVWESVDEAARESIGRMLPNLEEEERKPILEQRKDILNNQIRKWFEYGEYLRVEIDTEANTATVLEVAP